MRAILGLIVIVLALLLGGCGGGDEEISSGSVEATVSASILEDAAAGANVDETQCVEDGDDEHWRCLTVIRTWKEAAQVATSVTCDGSSEKCLIETTSMRRVP